MSDERQLAALLTDAIEDPDKWGDVPHGVLLCLAALALSQADRAVNKETLGQVAGVNASNLRSTKAPWYALSSALAKHPTAIKDRFGVDPDHDSLGTRAHAEITTRDGKIEKLSAELKQANEAIEPLKTYAHVLVRHLRRIGAELQDTLDSKVKPHPRSVPRLQDAPREDPQ